MKKHIFIFYLFCALWTSTATSIGLKCSTGQICCSYDSNRECTFCATPGNCPTYPCICPSECPSDTEWTSGSGTTAAKRCHSEESTTLMQTCDCEYRCSSGYYLATTSSKQCTRCPSQNGIYGTSVSNNTGNITSCYIPTGTNGSDTTGTFTYTGKSYYCE